MNEQIKPNRSNNNTIRIVFIVIVVILLAAIFGFVFWAAHAAGPMPEALNALESDEFIQVTIDDWYVFDPQDIQTTTGLILYPGGRVDPRSYAPQARLIALHGYKVVIVPMPLNLAVFGASKASQVMDTYPEITQWVVGGHSLGGAMAANFAHASPDRVNGLLLWAAYPAASDDLSTSTIPVTSIYASRDGLATPDKIAASRQLLPSDADFRLIEGGNHAQFGWYGPQKGDNEATITREQQQAEVVEGSLELLFRVTDLEGLPKSSGFLLPQILLAKSKYTP
ncbi:MAG: alpha/beta hydrolase [Anaerolineales bacterium]|jgi:hypothetical protein